MFQQLFISFLALCTSFFFNNLLAQEGYYEYNDKENETLSSLEIFKDGKFQFIKRGPWAISKTAGFWHKGENGEIILKSEFQVDDLNVSEFNDEERKGSFYFTFTADNYKRGARKIKSITINDHPALGCQMDNERVLEDMEARNELLTMGSKKDRDSAAVAYPNVYYECRAAGIDSIVSIDVKFDDHQVVYVPNNPTANTFIIKMQLAPDQTYRYFNDEAFIPKRRSLTSVETGEEFRKTRNPNKG